MTTFIHEPDGGDEPCIWAVVNGDTDNYRYDLIVRRVDLRPDGRHYWDELVEKITGEKPDFWCVLTNCDHDGSIPCSQNRQDDAESGLAGTICELRSAR